MDNILLAFGGAAKALGDGKFRVPMVVFGGEGDLSPLKDRFTKSTDFEVPVWPAPCTVRFEHGQNEFIGKKALAGGPLACKMDKDEVEVFVSGQLDMADRYESRIYKMIEDGKLGGSSGTVFHLIERKSLPDGGHEILRWPLGTDMSLTPKPADPRTRIHELKSLDGMKSVTENWDEIELAIEEIDGAKSLPMSDATTWNGSAAAARIKKWASNDKGEVDVKKASAGFARKGAQWSDLGLPFSDVVDGKLQANPRGILAAGASKGLDDAAQKVLTPYYTKMKKTPPWETKKSLTMEEFAAKSEFFGECIEENMTLAALGRIQDQLYYNIIYAVVMDDSLSVQEKTAKMAAAFAEYTQLAQLIFEALLGEDGTPDDEMKSLRTLWSDPKEFETLPLRQALKHVTTGLAETLERWDTEVFKFLSQGAKANQVLSNQNKQSAKNGYTAILEAKSHMEDIMDRAGVNYTESGTSDKEDAEKMLAEKEQMEKTLFEAKHLLLTH